MITTNQYALMAGHAYRTTREEINWIPAPEGWTPFFPVPDTTTATTFSASGGFEAISFTNGSEIVISYAGTYPTSIGDQLTNTELATGLTHNLLTGVPDQLLQAADYYLAVKAANPGATITFTGHSLGGGLAALMGVFFGVQAVTFKKPKVPESISF